MNQSLSFWEKQSFTAYDFIVVGGGIVGLSAAVAFIEKNPKANVLVLERGLFPSGASTKNAGFACFGSLTELLDDMQAMTGEEVVQLVHDRWNGLQLLRHRLGDAAIDFHGYGGFELLTSAQEPALQRMDEVNDLLRPLFQADVFVLADEKLKQFGLSPQKVQHLVENRFEGQINTGKMMKALQRLVAKQGVDVLTGAAVAAVEDHGRQVQVVVKKNRDPEITFTSNKVAVCTNAFARELIPGLELVPGRGQVLVTKPLKNLPFKGVFHYDEGYYYFRNLDKRIILGGGRNLDLKTEETTAFGTTDAIQQALHQMLREVILPGKPVEVEHTWSGIMAFGKVKKPVLQRISENVVAGVRLGGMGVAIGSLMGKRLVDMCLE